MGIKIIQYENTNELWEINIDTYDWGQASIFKTTCYGMFWSIPEVSGVSLVNGLIQ